MCTENSLHSTCFLGKLFCHPGYFEKNCSIRIQPANPWYTDDCPNLNRDVTYSNDLSFELLSQGKNCTKDNFISGISKCAYLCFSHPFYGVAQIPLLVWQQTLNNEVEAWKYAEGVDDRGIEHKINFNRYEDLPSNLGYFIEIGSGPYTQTQFIRDKNFDSITFLDPGSDVYQAFTKNCNYKNGMFFGRRVKVLNYGAENLHNDPSFGRYDTLMSINVIEHVTDAFLVLSNLYMALRKNGILIYHDR